MSPRFSVIATTYNQSRDLALYLRSLSLQNRDDFEIVIADDGSRADTKEVIESFQQRFFRERLTHIWHEDLGYRKSKIVNAAVRASRGEWLIFTDSDLVLHPHFVEDHCTVAAPRSMFMGRRVDLSPAASDWIRSHETELFTPRFYLEVVKSTFLGNPRSRGVKRAFRITPSALARALRCTQVPDLLGSNFSIDRELFYEVNGYDESQEHYWGEDGDLFVRVRNSGARISGRKSFAVQFHLWHPLRSPQKNAESAYRRKLDDRNYKKCTQGLQSGS